VDRLAAGRGPRGIHQIGPAHARESGKAARQRLARQIRSGTGRVCGCGSAGKMFAWRTYQSRTVPDLICLGKALTGGFPLSACVGRADLMDAAWPASGGEAIHTSTFLGHPVGCAMALAQIAEIRREKLVQRSARLGSHLLRELRRIFPVRSSRLPFAALGLMAGIEILSARPRAGHHCGAGGHQGNVCGHGFILLPEGAHANVISFTPPLTITRGQLTDAVKALRKILCCF